MSLTLPSEQQPEDTTMVPGVKRAVIYLRVSSAGQVNTDYDPEGLSIPAQREACKRYAERQGAVVVREYVEPGVSGGSLLKRAAFRRMIDETSEQRDVDLVIVWSVSRWARNQEDHWVARGLVTKAGAKLLSVKEPIGEESSHGILLEGVMAAAAAARRIEISEEVKRGIKRKIEVGGTTGLAPIGYLNIREALPQGGEVRTVIIDHERGPIIVWAYETYATGLYSLADIAILLEARGLRLRATRKRGPRPLSIGRVHKLLSNPYYAGFITHKGHTYMRVATSRSSAMSCSTRSRPSWSRTGSPASATANTSICSRARSAAAPAPASSSTRATTATAASTSTSSARRISAVSASRATSL